MFQRLLQALLVVLCVTGTAIADPKFLSLPFINEDVILLQGPKYDDGDRHLGPGFGLDYFLLDPNTPFLVIAAASGEAIKSDGSGFGNFVLIKHTETDNLGRFFTLYAHLEPDSIPSLIPPCKYTDLSAQGFDNCLPDDVSPLPVVAGHEIGTSDQTGIQGCTKLTTCHHLHFEVFRGGYTLNPIDPYNISSNDNPKTRDAYPPDGIAAENCGLNHLWAISCPPPLPASSIPLEDGPQFNFAVGFLAVDGNILGSGDADNIIDFLDNFNDGSLTTFPTSEFFFPQGVAATNESRGFLNLWSSDGTASSTDSVSGTEFLVDSANLGRDTASPLLLDDGAGDSTIIASFRADTPLPGQAYGLFVVTLPGEESVTIQVGATDAGPFLVGFIFPDRVGQSVPVNLEGVSQIILRLDVDDGLNRVIPSFSTDGGSTFNEIMLPQPGSVFTTSSRAFVSVFGSVIVSPSAPVTLASGLSNPNYLTVDQNNVYWTEFSGAIKKVSRDGGLVTTIAVGSGGGTGIAVDETHVYWGRTLGGGGGSIHKVPIDENGIVPLANANQPFDIAVDSTHVYWAENNGGPFGSNSVRKIPINGGAITTLHPTGTLHGIMAIDDTHVYFRYRTRFFKKIAKVNKNGGAVIDLASRLPNDPSGIVVNANSVYWAEETSGTINKVSINGGPVTTLASGLAKPQRIAVDQNNIFFTELGNGEAGAGAIKMVSINGGDVVTVAEGLNHPADIVVDNVNIYWTERGTDGTDGTVTKISK